MPSEAGRARVLFVNGGILGLISFYDFLQEWLTKQTPSRPRICARRSEMAEIFAKGWAARHGS
jgi:hypothetical protein